MIVETKNDRPGVGQERLLVRGGVWLPLDRAALLRARYNDYPERVALDVGFPAPGRRGPSRPVSSSPVVDEIAPDVGGVAKTPAKSPASSPYPAPRDPITRVVAPSGPIAAEGGSTAPVVSSNPCEGAGDSFAVLTAQGGGSLVTYVSPIITRPFVIHHLFAVGEPEYPQDGSQMTNYRIVVGETDSAAVDPNVEGVNVFPMDIGTDSWAHSMYTLKQATHRYTGFVVRQPVAYIKIHVKITAAYTQRFFISVDFRWLD